MASRVARNTVGHTAAVSSQCASVMWRNDCVGGFGKQMCRVSFGFGDVVWATSWLGWFAKSGWSANAVLVSPTKIKENCPSCSISGPSSRRQAAIYSETLPDICSLTPDGKGGVLSENCDDLKEFRGADTRSCASTRPARWQRGDQRRERAIACSGVSTGGFWTAIPPTALAGRSFGVSRLKKGRVALGAKSSENLRSEMESSDCSRIVPQMRAETQTSSGRRR